MADDNAQQAQRLRTWLETRARAAGFDAFGVTRPDAIPEAAARLSSFLADGAHGTMDWLAAHEDRRADPVVLWPDAVSVVLLGMNYGPADDPIATAQPANRGVISVYARGRDYHDVLKRSLKRIAADLAAETAADVKVFVDTAPLMEKPLAAAAGLGWQGKHTNLVSREFGSWLFLGAILTTATIATDAAHGDYCGSCTRCLDACPTRAFPEPYKLDARRCIAYLTIEHKGHIAEEFRTAIGNRVFGCDDCLAVCPWNKFASIAREHQFAARAETDGPSLATLLALDDATFRQRFAGTPIKRTGRDRIVRNALIAAGNAADPALLPHVQRHLGDPSPIVRAMAVWALGRLMPVSAYEALANTHLTHETDPAVRAEWSRTFVPV